MRKRAFLIIIVVALFITAFFIFKALATHHPWQLAPAASQYQVQPNSDAKQPANLDASGAWYSPANSDHQPEYYWYNSPKDSSWNNAYKSWWCR